MCSCQLVFLRARCEANLKCLELERLAETRWCYWYHSVSKVKLRNEIIVNVPGALSFQNIDRLATAEVDYITTEMF